MSLENEGKASSATRSAPKELNLPLRAFRVDGLSTTTSFFLPKPFVMLYPTARKDGTSETQHGVVVEVSKKVLLPIL